MVTTWTVSAGSARSDRKYSLGAITPGLTYSSCECDNCNDQDEETAPVVCASYAVGGGFSAFAEYLALETSRNGVADDETLLTSGITLGFRPVFGIAVVRRHLISTFGGPKAAEYVSGDHHSE